MDIKDRFWSKVNITSNPDDCWLWIAGTDKDGYGLFRTYQDGKPFIYRSHRLAYQWHYSDFDPDLHVLHKCDVPGCVNPAHLFQGTNLQNHLDKKDKGRSPKGERNGNSLLLDTEVREMRELFQSGQYSQADLARRYCVDFSTVSLIVRKKSRCDV